MTPCRYYYAVTVEPGDLAGAFIVPGLVYYLLHKPERPKRMGVLAVAMMVMGAILIPTSLTAFFLGASTPAHTDAHAHNASAKAL